MVSDSLIFKHALAPILSNTALLAHNDAVNVDCHLGVVRELAKADHCQMIGITHTELIDARFVVQNVQAACCHLHVDDVEVGQSKEYSVVDAHQSGVLHIP